MASRWASETRYSSSMSRTSRGVALTCPVSMRETLDWEHSSVSATRSMVRPASSRSRRSSAPRRRRRPVGVRVVIGADPLARAGQRSQVARMSWAGLHSASLQSLSGSVTLPQERPFSTFSAGDEMAATRTHERTLDAATRLFADEGIHATGVDRVIAEADVAPMTVYRHFDGKDHLVTATLARWSERWLGWLRDEARLGGDDPGTRLDALWDALEKWFADERFRGSYVANVATELRAKPGHPAQAVVAAHRAALRELLQDLLTGAGPPPPAAAVDHQPGAAAARAMATGLLAAQRPAVGALAGR